MISIPISRRAVVTVAALVGAVVIGSPAATGPSAATPVPAADAPLAPVSVPAPPRLPARTGHPSTIDLVASAHPFPGTPAAVDLRTEVVRWSVAPRIKINTVAAAVAVCDGCSAKAGAMQVVQQSRPGDVAADNLAIGTVTCSGCQSVALSIQVVLTQPGSGLVVSNHAQALTAGCGGCHSTAVAIQIVAIGGRGILSPRAEAELRAQAANLRSQLDQLAGGSPSARMRSSAQSAAQRLAQSTAQAIGGSTSVNVTVEQS